VRYTLDKRSLVDSSVSGAPATNNSVSFNKTHLEVTLDHSFTPDISAYVAIQHRFKSGLYISSILINAHPARNYQRGGGRLKTSALDDRVRFNTCFHYALSQVQVTAIVLGTKPCSTRASPPARAAKPS